MKYIFAGLFFALLFSSCSKTDNPNPKINVADSALVSMTDYMPSDKRKIVEKFTYDQNLLIATIRAYTYDSSSYDVPHLDSTYISFSSSIPSSSYDVTYYLTGNPPAGQTDHHILLYDNQGRVIIDSIPSTGSLYPSTQHFSYDNAGSATVQWFYPDPNSANGYSLVQTDTIVNVSGNAVMNTIYTVANGMDDNGNYGIIQTSLVSKDNFTYSSFVNPLHQDGLSKSLGALLFFNMGGDFVSKNLATQQTTTLEGGVPQLPVTFHWSNNSSGKVISGTAVSSVGETEHVYTFGYK